VKFLSAYDRPPVAEQPHPRPHPPDIGRLVGAGIVVAAVSLVAATLATGDVRVNGRDGDWHAVTEGLYRSGQPDILGATRRAIVHFHGLDGRPGLLVVTAASRRPEDPVRLTGQAGTEAFDRVLPIDPAPVTIALPRGTRDVDLRLEASGLFRVSEIALRRPRLPATEALRLLPSVAALVVLIATWRRMAWWTAMLWAALVGVGTAALWMGLVDASAALRFEPAVWDRLRVAAIALLWVAGLSCARSRVAVVAAVGGTVALLHLPSLWYGFHADDFIMARPWSPRELGGTLVGSFDPSGLLATNFRPLVSVSWAVDHRLWGAGTAGYHLTNLVLHAAAGVLLVFLLRRLQLPAPAALLGGLAWVAHPVTASTVAWVSARADSLMAIFYLSCLAAFCAPRSRDVLIVGTAVLALGAKEMAATLPLAALLLDRVLLPRDEAAARRPRLRLLVLVTAAYVAYWAALFMHRLLMRPTGGTRWSAFDAHRASDWLYVVGGLYAPLFLPPRYEVWWSTPLRGWPSAYLAGAAALALAAWWVAQRGPRLGGRAATVGLLWAPLTAIPLLGLSGLVDLYRVGYLVAVTVAFVVAGIVIRIESSRLAAAALAAVLAVLLAPLSLDAARAWGREGFQVRTAQQWGLADPDLPRRLTPEMAQLFAVTAERDRHAMAWAHPEMQEP
jgi:hypothetical protein